VAKGRYENDDKYNVLCPDCGSAIQVSEWREECVCGECANEFVPEEGNVSRGKYSCPDCGQKYGITDAIQEQGGYDLRLYGVEYYCPECDENGRQKSVIKGYKAAESADRESFDSARQEWEEREELRQYIPDENLPPGHMISERNPVFDHGYNKWSDMYNERQLLCLSQLLRSIESIENKNSREFLLLTFSDFLRTNSLMCSYQPSRNHSNHVFKTNSFDPPYQPSEGNVWGAKYGMGTFESAWDMVKSGVEYANAPTERYVSNGDSKESPPFAKPIGDNTNVYQGDMRVIDAEDEYDAVITDPPYYDNIMYSEVSDYFYVWQKILLEDEYDGFDQEKTPRAESIVANPYLGKGSDEFESELHEAFSAIHKALKDDGTLAFTYHHSDSESWGELLASLCDVGFEITATYPISADMNKFISGETVEFDIIIVARPAGNRQPVSWKSLRRNIVRTAKRTHKRLTENRELSDGNIGVIEMGREVVDEIYGIIQQGSDIGEVDVFLDVLEMDNPAYNDLNMLTRGTSANPETMEEILLYRMEGGDFVLGTWNDEKRQAYIQEQVNGKDDNGLTPLDKAQFLRYRYEQGKSIQNYLQKWTLSDDLRELCQELAEASGDDVYTRILGGDRTIGDF
jgi:ssDNA-binding Zn-finger/Zn-ribbon topoisomerase 1